jgi:hypothetical protein
MKTALAGTRHTLNEVKARVLADHRQIRTLLEDVTRVAASLSTEGDVSARESPLTGPIWRLFLGLDDHLAYEETELAPLLLESGAWGKIRAQQLRDEHHAQRTVLLAMTHECDGKTKTPGELIDDARWLVQSLRADMAHEEAELNAIVDDGFVVDQSTG